MTVQPLEVIFIVNGVETRGWVDATESLGDALKRLLPPLTEKGAYWVVQDGRGCYLELNRSFNSWTPYVITPARFFVSESIDWRGRALEVEAELQSLRTSLDTQAQARAQLIAAVTAYRKGRTKYFSAEETLTLRTAVMDAAGAYVAALAEQEP